MSHRLQLRPILLILITLLLGGCLGHQKGSVVPGTAVSGPMGSVVETGGPTFEVHGNYYVEMLPSDGRSVNELIVDQLRARGLKAATGAAGMAPDNTDVIVSYQDRWMWDMTMYMIRLNIQFKSPNGDLLASGESYRTSMIRKPPEYMVDEIFNEIFEEVDPSLVVELPVEEAKITRRSRQGTNQSSDGYKY